MVCWAALVVKHDFAACAVIYAKSFCSTQAAMSEPVGDTIDNVVGRHKQNTSFVVLIAAEQIVLFVFDARVSIFALQVDTKSGYMEVLNKSLERHWKLF